MGAVLLVCVILLPVVFLISLLDVFCSCFVPLFNVFKIVGCVVIWFLVVKYGNRSCFGSNAEFVEYVIGFFVHSFAYVFVLGTYWLLTFQIKGFFKVFWCK